MRKQSARMTKFGWDNPLSKEMEASRSRSLAAIAAVHWPRARMKVRRGRVKSPIASISYRTYARPFRRNSAAPLDHLCVLCCQQRTAMTSDAGTGAELVDLVQQVDDVEPYYGRLEAGVHFELLGDASVDHRVRCTVIYVDE